MRFPFVRKPEEDGIDARHSVTPSERTLTQILITSTNCLISAVVCFEAGSQLFKFRFASLTGNDAFLSKYDGLCPLHVRGVTYVIFYSSSVSFFESRTFYASISDIRITNQLYQSIFKYYFSPISINHLFIISAIFKDCCQIQLSYCIINSLQFHNNEQSTQFREIGVSFEP